MTSLWFTYVTTGFIDIILVITYTIHNAPGPPWCPDDQQVVELGWWVHTAQPGNGSNWHVCRWTCEGSWGVLGVNTHYFIPFSALCSVLLVSPGSQTRQTLAVDLANPWVTAPRNDSKTHQRPWPASLPGWSWSRCMGKKTGFLLMFFCQWTCSQKGCAVQLLLWHCCWHSLCARRHTPCEPHTSWTLRTCSWRGGTLNTC